LKTKALGKKNLLLFVLKTLTLFTRERKIVPKIAQKAGLARIRFCLNQSAPLKKFYFFQKTNSNYNTKTVSFEGRLKNKKTFALWKINPDLTLRQGNKAPKLHQMEGSVFANLMLFKP
jgi:hypothetical protein